MYQSKEWYRERELTKLVLRKTSSPSTSDYNQARRLMKKFYKLCEVSERNLILNNDPNKKYLKSTIRSGKKEHKIFHILETKFRTTYGLTLYYSGFFPAIGIKNGKTGRFTEIITRYF